MPLADLLTLLREWWKVTLGAPAKACCAAHCYKPATALQRSARNSWRRGHRSCPRWRHRPFTTRVLDGASFVDGIVVSNRGGFVEDSGRATIDALP
jgi:hypothetical protein